MKTTSFIPLIFMLAVGTVHSVEKTSKNDAVVSEDEVDVAKTAEESTQLVVPDSMANFCFFAGRPPVTEKYEEVRKLKVGKGTYGHVTEILPKLVAHAQKIGADAIVNYTGSQRFGFWPWRAVRPVVRGTAVKWSDQQKRDCEAIGGTTLKTIMTTNKAPPA